MKFAAPYKESGCPISEDNIDEYNIVFHKKSTIPTLNKFLKMYPNKKVNVLFEEDEFDVDELENVYQLHDNFCIRLRAPQLKYVDDLNNRGIPFMLDRSMAVYSYCLLEWVLSKHPQSIYIVDDLLYNLKDVSEECHSNNIGLRLVLNRIPTMNGITAFCPTVMIFKPQDYNILSQYIDIGEFDCGKEYDWTKCKVLYKKWYIEHEWEDDMYYMNQDLLLPFPTQSMPPELTEIKLNCKHRCTMSSHNMCRKCHRYYNFGYMNADAGLRYKKGIKQGIPSPEEMLDILDTMKS